MKTKIPCTECFYFPGFHTICKHWIWGNLCGLDKPIRKDEAKLNIMDNEQGYFNQLIKEGYSIEEAEKAIIKNRLLNR